MTPIVYPEHVWTEFERLATSFCERPCGCRCVQQLRRDLETDGEAAMLIVLRDEAGNLAGWLQLSLRHFEMQCRWHWRDSKGRRGVAVAGSEKVWGVGCDFMRAAAIVGTSNEMKITSARKYNTQVEKEEYEEVLAAQSAVSVWALEDANRQK